MFFRKKRWICEEMEAYLLSLPLAYYIQVHINVNGTKVAFSFRDAQFQMVIDPYERNVIDVDIDFLKLGFDMETIYVGKQGINHSDVPYVKARIDRYVDRCSKLALDGNENQLGEMREKLRAAICDSMGIDFIRDKDETSPSIGIALSDLSLYQKRRVCDLICSLDEDAVNVHVSFLLDYIDEKTIGNTCDQLALFDAQREAEESESEDEYGF